MKIENKDFLDDREWRTGLESVMIPVFHIPGYMVMALIKIIDKVVQSVLLGLGKLFLVDICGHQNV